MSRCSVGFGFPDPVAVLGIAWITHPPRRDPGCSTRRPPPGACERHSITEVPTTSSIGESCDCVDSGALHCTGKHDPAGRSLAAAGEYTMHTEPDRTVLHARYDMSERLVRMHTD